MAQLNDLIVNGYSRFLNSAYGNLNGSATSALCAAYAASTNTAIKVNSAISATSAYDVINKAIKVNSATSATCAYDVINKAINVNSAGSAAKAASATSALSAGSAAKAAELTNKAIKVNSAGSADYATSAGSAPFISHNHNYQLSGNGTALYISAGVNLKPNGNIAISTAANTINISAKDTTYTSLNGINSTEYNALTSTSANKRDPKDHQLSSHTNFSTYFNGTSANTALTAGYATQAGDLYKRSIGFSRTVAQGGDGKKWCRIASISRPNFTTASDWGSCEAELNIYTKSYGEFYTVDRGKIVLYCRWGHASASTPTYSMKTNGSRGARWLYWKPQSTSTSVSADSAVSAYTPFNGLKNVDIKIVATDTSVEWWLYNDVWDTTLEIIKIYSNNITLYGKDSPKTLGEFKTYLEDNRSQWDDAQGDGTFIGRALTANGAQWLSKTDNRNYNVAFSLDNAFNYRNTLTFNPNSNTLSSTNITTVTLSGTTVKGVTTSGTSGIFTSGKINTGNILTAYGSSARFDNISSTSITGVTISGTNITATTFSGNLSGSAASALTSKSALSAGSAKNAEWARSADYLGGYVAGSFAFPDGNYSAVGGLTAKSARGAYSASTANYSNSTNTAIKVNSAGSAEKAASATSALSAGSASTYPVDYDSCVVTYGETGCFTKIKNAYTANKKIYMLAKVQSYPGNAGNSICKIPLTYSLITGTTNVTTYNCFSFNFVNDGGIGYWGSTAEQQGVVYSFTCSSDAADGWHTQGVNPYASTVASTAGTAYYINVNSSNTNTWFNVPLYSASNNQFYYDSNYSIRYNPNVDALSANNILTKAVASNQGAISWQAWKSCMLLYGSNTAHTVDLSNLSEDVVYWLFVGGPKTIYLTHTANNISLHCYDTTFPLNKSSTTESAFRIRDNACFTTGAGTAHYHGTFAVPIVKASSGDLFVMMSYGDCH